MEEDFCMKKVVSILLVLVMCMGLMTGCVFGNTEEGSDPTTAPVSNQSGDNGETTTPTDAAVESALAPMTTENIELTYFNFVSEVLTQILAEKFMEKYPNI